MFQETDVTDETDIVFLIWERQLQHYANGPFSDVELASSGRYSLGGRYEEENHKIYDSSK